MTQEDKQLLLKDLCARVFYGVKVNIERDFPNNPQIVERIGCDGEIIVQNILAYDIYYYKPYLRPMSSMTEEEKEELLNLRKEMNMHQHSPWIDRVLDFYLSHHLDWRGLIPKGLALEAPEGMYKTE